MNKCALIFIAGMIVSLASYAFFNQMMQMGQQMMHTPQQMMGDMMFPVQDTTKAQPQTLVCDCNCNK